jgi:hypothetical protein
MHKNSFNVNLDRQKCIVTISFEQLEYREEDFDEFLLLFESTWLLIKKENLVCHLFINLENCRGNYNFPLQVYIKLSSCLSNLNEPFNSNCHGICILTDEAEVWRGIYNIIIKLWHPPIRRPIILTDKLSEIKLFIKTNKLIK